MRANRASACVRVCVHGVFVRKRESEKGGTEEREKGKKEKMRVRSESIMGDWQSRKEAREKERKTVGVKPAYSNLGLHLHEVSGYPQQSACTNAARSRK